MPFSEREVAVLVCFLNGRPVCEEELLRRNLDMYLSIVRYATWDAAGRELSVTIAPLAAGDISKFKATLVLFLPTAGVPFVYTSADHPALPPALDGLNKQFESKSMRLVQLLVVLLQTVTASCADWFGPDLSVTSDGTAALREALRAQLARDPVPIEFGVSVISTASRGPKRASSVEPFPPFLRTREHEPDHESLAAMLSALPSLTELKAQIDHMSTEQLKLLHWVSVLRGVVRVYSDPSAKPAGADHTEICFEPASDPLFDEAARKYGTTTGYHGSAAENFWSILCTGLRNFSGTDRMTSGDICGAGVYLSTDLRVSSNFSREGSGWAHSRFGSNVMFVAQCEVALDPSVKRYKSEGNAQFPTTYIVVPNSELVRIRKVLVFSRRTGGLRSATATASGPIPFGSFGTVVAWAALALAAYMCWHIAPTSSR